jgi:hypothetical protein
LRSGARPGDLIFVSGVGHLAALFAAPGSSTGLLVISAGFGLLYIITGIGLFVGKWQFNLFGVIFS